MPNARTATSVWGRRSDSSDFESARLSRSVLCCTLMGNRLDASSRLGSGIYPTDKSSEGSDSSDCPGGGHNWMKGWPLQWQILNVQYTEFFYNCGHGDILLEIGFGLWLTILLGKFLDVLFALRALLVHDMVQGATCIGFEFFWMGL
jgi:hypothetical protein